MKKILEETIDEMRKLRQEGLSIKDIKIKTGVSNGTVKKYISGMKKGNKKRKKKKDLSEHVSSSEENKKKEEDMPINDKDIKKIVTPLREEFDKFKEVVNTIKKPNKEDEKMDISDKDLEKITNSVINAVKKTNPKEDVKVEEGDDHLVSVINTVLDKRDKKKEKNFEEQKKIDEEKKKNEILDDYGKRIKDLESFCKDNPDSPLCTIARREAKSIVPKETKKKIEGVISKLPEIDKEKRKKLATDNPEALEERDKQFAKLLEESNATPVDAWNYVWGDAESKKNIGMRSDVKETVLSNMSVDDIKKTIPNCTGEECKILIGELNTRLKQEKKKGSHF